MRHRLSLPEEIGGARNWDYRYAWLRDGAFTLYALIRLGFVEESDAFIGWLQGRLSDDAERGPLQVVYRVDGQRDLNETTLDHLSDTKIRLLCESETLVTSSYSSIFTGR